MFIVNLSKTWPAVLAGKANAADATLGDWAQVSDTDLEAHADVILGVHKNVVVSAFDIISWSRLGTGRVRFEGVPSEKWEHMIGTPTPGKPWVPGQVRPVQVLPTSFLTTGNVPVEETATTQRAVVGGYILTVTEDCSAILQVPAGSKVTIQALAS
jgi:hypothetical protein